MKSSTFNSFLAVSALFIYANTAQASDVSYIDVTADGGIHIDEGIVKVSAVNGNFSNVAQQTVPYYVKMKAGCKGNKLLNQAFVSFGSEKVGSNFIESNDNFRVVVPAQVQKDLPYTDVKLNVPIAKLGKNPAEMCQNLLNEKVASGVSKQQFLASEHTINAPATISAVAQCSKLGSSDGDFGLDFINSQIKIICAAGGGGVGSELKAPKLPIVAVPLGGSNNVMVGVNPLMISQGQITAQTLHYFGQCPAQMNFQVHMQGSGKGQVRYHIVENGQDAFVSPALPFEGGKGGLQHAFSVNITSTPATINQAVNRSFRLFVELKDESDKAFDWSKKGQYASLNWSHTCQAQAAIPVPGQIQGGVPKPVPPGITQGGELKPGLRIQTPK